VHIKEWNTYFGGCFVFQNALQTMEEKNMLGKVPCNYIGNIGTSLYTTIDQPTIPIVLVKLGSSHHMRSHFLCVSMHNTWISK
jgi:hypothetical protein